MRRFICTVLPVILSAGVAGAAECPAGNTCVEDADLATFLTVMDEKRCLLENKPTVKLDPIQITEDKAGRMFVSGGNSYKVRLDWCTYTVDVTANLAMQVARYVEPEWGMRWRVKVAPGYLPLDALQARDAGAGVDIGLMLEPFFYRSFNLNGYVGVRSIGVNVGLDLTRNVGVHAGYALAFGSVGGPHVALSFSLW